ncbi:histidinol-phosphate aminotransferase family protein [Acutalibacter sp. 1XD8-33]|uniref:pyridoxal phosphate-dependent aminotransferase n=1 Tax=Acutalibacter sp. 1XD8-33 TaxID=2320081 RepID=UPI000EA14AB0|nr:histidinol-phosphate transaminase [Acutalibacter sp. 1XD8-33]RKJ40702.1 histidinol-phosphate aminotransferase family protein [Acutalibacter sp. 1XD8-33]
MYQLNGKLRALRAYEPVDGGDCVHLDANESFLELPEEVAAESKALIDRLAFNRYPDPAAGELCGAFARYYGVDPRLVTAGNGSDELISVLFSGFLMRGETFATLEPDFSMYAQGGALAEARHVPIQKRDFRVDVDEVIETCRREGVRMLIFSNPCNPTSIVLPREEVHRLIRGVEGLVVLDEAYMDFSGQSLLDEAEDYENLIILRTCSKAMGMAALRLGFAVCREELAQALRAAKSPYNVNALSQGIGAAALNRPQLLRSALETVLASRRDLLAGLEELGRKYPGRFRLLPCDTNFAALDMPGAKEAQEALLSRGVAVRFTGGLLRVTCGKPQENRLFLQKFQEILEGTP